MAHQRRRTLWSSITLLFVVCGATVSHGQTVTSSPLPIVLIQTDGDISIPDAYKVPATMKILYVNDTTTNYLSNQYDTAYLHYEGRIGIEKRGSTSQNLSKRHYGFETRQQDDVTNDNVSLLGMPEENDWILNPLNYDNTYLRDPLSYELARRTGHYAPRTHYCEVFVGGNYRGIYFLTEKIKADKNRVNIAKMDSTDNSYPKVTGGYIIKADKTTGGDPVAWSTPAHDYWQDVDYIHHYPKPNQVTDTQSTYIRNYFAAFQSIMDQGDNTIITGYPSLIDVPSFIDYMILGELSSNVDIYQKSTFFHKDRMGKLCAGPVWDFNLAYGNDLGTSPGRSGYNVWQFDNEDNTGSEFWIQLFNDEQFQRLFARRWYELTAPGGPLALDTVLSIIDALDNQIIDMVSRDKQRWGYNFSHTSAVNSMKTWLQARYNWLNNHLTDTANTLPDVPALAISKIHYHPHRWGDYSSDDLEFIGITNLTGSALSLAGVYLRELGISYQFPPSAVIDSAQEIYIAANMQAFRARYGVEPFGQFSRSLNNHTQHLVLTDAWGRTIDDVTYSDESPWPTAADGNGPFLTLLDLTADHNDGSNWTTDTTLLHPVCDTVTNIAIAVEAQTVLVHWTDLQDANTWEVLYGLSPVDTLAAAPITVYDTALSLSNLEGGNYDLYVRARCDENLSSYWSEKNSFYISGVGINDFTTKQQLSIYPNPACDIVNIQLHQLIDNGTVRIHDICGRVIITSEIHGSSLQLSTEKLSPGFYMVTVQNGIERTSGRLVIEH